jgi:hypothetical protein
MFEEKRFRKTKSTGRATIAGIGGENNPWCSKGFWEEVVQLRTKNVGSRGRFG